MNKMLLAAALSVAAISAPALAVVNAGFETGDLSGWTAVGGASAVTSHSAGNSSNTWAPVEGNFFARLTAGLGTGVYSTLTQTFSLAANQTISGYVGYQAEDYQPFTDDAFLTIGSTVLFTASTFTVGDFGSSGWQAWSFTAPTAGSYTLQLGVRNTSDNVNTPSAMLDGVSTAVVPEPQTWALMIIGFGLVGVASRRRTVAHAA
jgi:hypothetical protein